MQTNTKSCKGNKVIWNRTEELLEQAEADVLEILDW